MMKSCVQMAEKIAEMSPVAVQGTKINLNYARDHSVQVWYFKKVYLVRDIQPPNHKFFSVLAVEKEKEIFKFFHVVKLRKI